MVSSSRWMAFALTKVDHWDKEICQGVLSRARGMDGNLMFAPASIKSINRSHIPVFR